METLNASAATINEMAGIDDIIAFLEKSASGAGPGVAAKLRQSAAIVARIKHLEMRTLPPMDEDMGKILGMPNFACVGVSQALRATGVEIKNRAEDEQAAVIYFLLKHYLASPITWRDDAATELALALAAKKAGA